MTKLATRKHIPIDTMDDVARVSGMMANSGFFADAKDAAQAGVKIMAGMAWGIDPFSSMTGIHIIKGRPTVSAGLMASAVKASGKYDYRIRQRDADRCEIAFFEGGEELTPSSVYTIEMAERAGLTGNGSWQKHPEAMLFARAMSQGVRMHAPDVFSSSVYTPEELGAEVDGDDVVVAVATTEPVQARQAPISVEVHVESEPEPEAVVEAPEAPEGIGTARANKLRVLLEREGVDKDVEFATLMLGRTVTALSDITEEEGVQLLKDAKHANEDHA